MCFWKSSQNFQIDTIVMVVNMVTIIVVVTTVMTSSFLEESYPMVASLLVFCS
jgi:hypothetical protein